MKLTNEQARSIVKQVYSDLDFYYDNNYPIRVTGFEMEPDKNAFAHWLGGFDYRNPIGDDGWGKYPEYIVVIDDEKGEAIEYSYYTGHYAIELNDEGKYTVVRQLGR